MFNSKIVFLNCHYVFETPAFFFFFWVHIILLSVENVKEMFAVLDFSTWGLILPSDPNEIKVRLCCQDGEGTFLSLGTSAVVWWVWKAGVI